jgi:hypothetical protein
VAWVAGRPAVVPRSAVVQWAVAGPVLVVSALVVPLAQAVAPRAPVVRLR